MHAKFFLDSNIIIYAIEGVPAAKAVIAEELISRGIKGGAGVISYQVVQECLNAVLSKARIAFTPEDALDFLRSTLEPLCKVFPDSTALFEAAVEVHGRYRYSFYDSLIIAAALEAGCETLYSEDFQHGQQIGRLRIENPFVA
jgi:predicted nucleic acid-binding protein